MSFADCARAASEYGLMMVSSTYTSTGWQAHRVGDQALTFSGSWDAATFSDVTDDSVSCVVGTAAGSAVRDTPLPSETTVTTSDGLTWTYHDFGDKYYDECQLLASEAGTEA